MNKRKKKINNNVAERIETITTIQERKLIR